MVNIARLLPALALAAALPTAAPAVTLDAAAAFDGTSVYPGKFSFSAGPSSPLSPGNCGELQCLTATGGSGFFKSPDIDRESLFFTYPADRLVAISQTTGFLGVFADYVSGRGAATVRADYLLSFSGADLDLRLVDLANQIVVGDLRLNGAKPGGTLTYDFTGGGSFALLIGQVGVPFGTPPAAGTPGDYVAAFDFSISSVPEPATWGLMIAGFGLVGAVLRRRGALPA